jgi:gliding motility-associated-like protein
MVNFTATAANAGTSPSYQWKVNGTNVGTNTATYSSSSLSNGDVVTCTVTKDPLLTCVIMPNANSNAITMAIASKNNPGVTITTNSTSVCMGAGVTFLAAPSNAGTNPSYNWKVNGIEVNVQTRTFTTSALVNGDEVSCDMVVDPGYTCTNTDQASSNTITMTVTTQEPPTVSISVQGDNVCAPATLKFTADVQNAGVSPSYQWIVDNQPVGNNNSPTLNITTSNSKQVQLAIIPGNGSCNTAPVNSNGIFAVVHQLPVVGISPSDTLIKVGGQVQLHAAIQANMGHHEWDHPGKLQNPFVLNPTTIPLTENTTYTLYVESDKGCRASASAIVRVGRVFGMPNAFTPNSDGKHDVFRIPSFVLFHLKEFTIYDRWGNSIFSTQDISKGWDGTFKGQKLNAGVYVYMITGSNEQGNVVVKGTVNLVR